MYGGLNHGRVDVGRLRTLLSGEPESGSTRAR